MFMSFFNALPLSILILLGLAVLGLYDCLKKLYTWHAKTKMFINYRKGLAKFHNNAIENEVFDRELSDYLLENSFKINLDSIIKIRIDHPRWGISTGMMTLISDIVTGDCYNFTETCQSFENMLTQNIGVFKNQFQETRSKIIDPIHLVKNGVCLIFDRIPIVNLIPTKIKNFLYTLFIGISIVETLLSLFAQKSLLESIIQQIIAWIP